MLRSIAKGQDSTSTWNPCEIIEIPSDDEPCSLKETQHTQSSSGKHISSRSFQGERQSNEDLPKVKNDGTDDDDDLKPGERDSSANPVYKRNYLKRTSSDVTTISEDSHGRRTTKKNLPPEKVRKWTKWWVDDDDQRKRDVGKVPTSLLKETRLSDLEKSEYQPLDQYPPAHTEKERQDRLVFEANLKNLDGPVVTITNFVDGSTPSRTFRFINECVNAADVAPLGVEWIESCDCSRCGESDSCSCMAKGDRGLCAYYSSGPKKGCLTAKFGRSGEHIFECNSGCRCKAKCINVKVQLGRKIPLEIFKTQDRGWGLRCPMGLMRGEFIDTYRGERIKDAEADRRGRERDAAGEHDKYFFDLDKFKPPETIPRTQFLIDHPEKLQWHRNLVASGKYRITREDDDDDSDDDSDGDGGGAGDELWANPAFAAWEEDDNVVIDGRDMGGPTRWMNHSCEPNCHIMTASTVHADEKIYDIAFFTLRAVAAHEELTFDYKGENDGEVISDEMAARLSLEKGYEISKCRCGADTCRRYFFE